MATFIFRGDPRDLKQKDGSSLRGDGPGVITLSGVTFRKGEPTEVSDEATAKKLRGNTHFQEVTKAARSTGVTAGPVEAEASAEPSATHTDVVQEGAHAHPEHHPQHHPEHHAEHKAKAPKRPKTHQK